MNRVTDKDLERIILRLNKAAGTPPEPYSWTLDAPLSGKAEPGDKRPRHRAPCAFNYHLESAYGSVGLAQMAAKGTATKTIFALTSKRELYDLIHAYIAGIEAGQNRDNAP